MSASSNTTVICVWSSGKERRHIWLVLHVLTNTYDPSA